MTHLKHLTLALEALDNVSTIQLRTALLAEAMSAHKVNDGRLRSRSWALSTHCIVEVFRLCLDFLDFTLHVAYVLHVLIDSSLVLFDLLVLFFECLQQIQPEDSEFEAFLSLNDF